MIYLAAFHALFYVLEELFFGFNMHLAQSLDKNASFGILTDLQAGLFAHGEWRYAAADGRLTHWRYGAILLLVATVAGGAAMGAASAIYGGAAVAF